MEYFLSDWNVICANGICSASQCTCSCMIFNLVMKPELYDFKIHIYIQQLFICGPDCGFALNLRKTQKCVILISPASPPLYDVTQNRFWRPSVTRRGEPSMDHSTVKSPTPVWRLDCWNARDQAPGGEMINFSEVEYCAQPKVRELDKVG